MRQRYAVSLGAQQVRRQEGHHLEVRRAVEQRPRRERGRQARTERLERVDASQRRADVRRVKLLDMRRQGEPREMREQRVARLPGVQEEPAPERAATPPRIEI